MLYELTENLRLALQQVNIPTGLAVDLGTGGLHYTRVLAEHFPGQTIGFELEPDLYAFGSDMVQRGKLAAEVRQQNVLDYHPDRESLSVVTVGMTIYIPKDICYGLINKFWQALKPGGILHVDFAHYEDGAHMSRFIYQGCIPHPEHLPGSYLHTCADVFCMHYQYGQIGGSFWDPGEAYGFLCSFGGEVLYFRQALGEQVVSYDTGEIAAVFQRSFFSLTVQK